MAMLKTKPINDDFAPDIEADECEPGQQRLAFFKALRRLRNILEAEYWLLNQGIKYEETFLVVKKSMLFDTLVDLEPEMDHSAFSPAEMDDLLSTRELATNCRALMMPAA